MITFDWWLTTDRFRPEVQIGSRFHDRPWHIAVGRAMLDRQTIHIHDIRRESEDEFPDELGRRASGIRTVLGRAVAARRSLPIGVIMIRRTEVQSFHRQANQASRNLCRSSRHRHRERAACSRNSRSATQNCARLWSIRRQRPRCSASSAARRRTCSRSSTPSSRARRGFAGSMTWCCDSARGTLWFRGLILVPIPM